MNAILKYIDFKEAVIGFNAFAASYHNTSEYAYYAFRNLDDTINTGLYNRVQSDIDKVIAGRLADMLDECNEVLKRHGFDEASCPLTDYDAVKTAIVSAPIKQLNFEVLNELDPVMAKYYAKDYDPRKDLFHFWGLYHRDIQIFNAIYGGDQEQKDRIKVMQKRNRERKKCIWALNGCEQINMEVRKGKLVKIGILYKDRHIHYVPALYVDNIMRELDRDKMNLLATLDDANLAFDRGNALARIRIYLQDALGRYDSGVSGGDHRSPFVQYHAKRLNAIYKYMMDSGLYSQVEPTTKREQILAFIIKFLGMDIEVDKIKEY